MSFYHYSFFMKITDACAPRQEQRQRERVGILEEISRIRGHCRTN